MFFAAYGAVPDYLWLGLVLPPLFLGFGVVLLVFGDQLTPDEPRFLVEFVARTIEAVEERDRVARILIEHDLFGKPASTFPDHALGACHVTHPL
jgi:hypothetical protein